MSPRRHTYATLERLEDEAVMLALQGETVEALDVLQGRHGASIHRYLTRFTHDPVVAEDLAQETFMRVYKSRHSYRPVARFTTWLYTIAGNLARSEYSKWQRRRAHLSPYAHDADEGEREIPDETYVPDALVARSMETERVMRAIDRLPERFREVVMLRGIQDLSYEEIHRLTGVPLGTIKSRIHRGRTMLSGMLEE